MRNLTIFADSLDGGMGASVMGDVRWALEMGFKVTLVSGSELNLTDHSNLTFNRLGVPKKLNFGSEFWKARREGKSILRAALARRDVIFAHGIKTATLIAPSREINVILHGDGGYRGEPSIRSMLRKATILVFPIIAGRCMTVSSKASIGWEQIWIESPNLSSLEYGSTRAQPQKQTQLVWFGRIEQPKRIDLFLDLVERLRLSGFLVDASIYGPGTSAKEDVRARAMKLSIQVNDGYYRPEDVLNGDKIFCLFSDFEGRPFATEEAVVAGIPVCVSDIGAHRLMFGADAEGLVRDVQNAVDFISKYMDGSQRKELAKRQYQLMNQEKSKILLWSAVRNELVSANLEG